MKEPSSTVLVPLDGSKSAECVLPYAIVAAEKLNTAIELLCVASRKNMRLEWPGWANSKDMIIGVEGGPSEYLNATAKRIEAASSVPVLRTALFGSAEDVIVRHSKVHGPELVILSTHGAGPLSRVWLGSVADRVMRHTSMPVLLVRPKEGAEVDLNHPVDFRHILIALDGSLQAEASIYWAKRLGGAETTYTLLRVEPRRAPAWPAEPECSPFYIRDYSRSGHEEAAEYLRGVAQRAMSSSKQVATEVVEGVPAPAGILRAADQKAADLITLTSHGRGRLPNLILGSVTDKVARASTLPVLVVRRLSVESALPAAPEASAMQAMGSESTAQIRAELPWDQRSKRRRSDHIAS